MCFIVRGILSRKLYNYEDCCQTDGRTAPVWRVAALLTLDFLLHAVCYCSLPSILIVLFYFRSFISSLTATNSSREVVLFFGCRNKEADFFFADEWSQCSGHVKVITGFSRDQVTIYTSHIVYRMTSRCTSSFKRLCIRSGREGAEK